MLSLQSALLFGSLSWSPWYDAWPVHWLLVTTNLMCVATVLGATSQYLSVRSGATGRGLTDGNASPADETTFVQPASIDPSQVGFAATFPARHAWASNERSAVNRLFPSRSCAETPSRWVRAPSGLQSQ